MKICRPFITKNGVRIYAKDRGMKAFCWEVTEEEHQAYLEKKAKEKAKKQSEAKEKKAKKPKGEKPPKENDDIDNGTE